MINRLFYFLQDFSAYLLLLLVTGVIAVVAIYRKPSNLMVCFVATIMSVVVIFIVAEAYFRYAYEASDGIGFLKIAQKWHNRHVIFNSHFRRDSREFVPIKTDNEIRIGTIGDSITFGIGIENPQDRYSNILERKLRADGINAVVYNLGMSGIDTDDEITDFHRLEPENLGFDLITWQYFLNDINTATNSANAQITKRGTYRLEKLPWLKFIVDNSFFADFLYWRLSSRHEQTFVDLVNEDMRLYHDPSIIRGHQAQIKEFIAELKKKQIPVIVIMFPLIHSEEIRTRSRLEYQEMLTTFQSASPEAIVDLDKVLVDYPVTKLRASRFDQHPNELVHRLVADELYDTVKTILKL